MMNSNIFNTGVAGAVGPSAQASNVTINQNYGTMLSGIDMLTLAPQLDKLKKKLITEAKSTEQLLAVAAVSGAHDAAKSNQPSVVGEKLKGLGGWVLDTATKIGCTVAAEAIKKASGF